MKYMLVHVSLIQNETILKSLLVNHCCSNIVFQTVFKAQRRNSELPNASPQVWDNCPLKPKRPTTRQTRHEDVTRQTRCSCFKLSKKNGRDKRFQKSIDEDSEKMKIRTRGTWKIMETCLNPCFSNLFFDSNHVSTCICIFHIAVSGFILCKKKNLYIGKLIHDRKCMCILEY